MVADTLAPYVARASDIHGIDYVRLTGHRVSRIKISVSNATSMSMNERKCDYIFMFHLTNLHVKG